jgi:lipooligosaccharide transport system permease protein
MSSSDTHTSPDTHPTEPLFPVEHGDRGQPSLFNRLYSVWFRHMRVYTRHLVSNALPPFLEPLIFLAGIGLGLGKYVGVMNGMPYTEYLAGGLLITTAMFTATFECSFGTYIRMEFDKVYDGMLAAPITAENLLVGEMLWAGTKGFVFSFSVLIIASVFGVISFLPALGSPLIGFVTGVMFAALGFLATSFVTNINQFNFLFTGLLSPMFFFSGVVFPIENLPPVLRPVAELMPLTHPVRVVRGMIDRQWTVSHWGSILYILLFTVVIGAWAIHRLKRRLID